MKFKTNFERYSGLELESDTILQVSKEAVYHKGEDPYMGFNQSLEVVMQNQPKGWSPEDPPSKPTSFSNDLHFFVLEKLQNSFPEDEIELKMFTASKSCLDWEHGVDFFFTAAASGGYSVMVTVDLKMKPDAPAHKAEVILSIPPMFFDKEKMTVAEKEKLINVWAEELSADLKDKLADVKRSRQLGRNPLGLNPVVNKGKFHPRPAQTPPAKQA